MYIVTFIFIKNIEYRNIVIFIIGSIDIMTTKLAYKMLRCKYSYESEEYAQYFEHLN